MLDALFTFVSALIDIASFVKTCFYLLRSSIRGYLGYHSSIINDLFIDFDEVLGIAICSNGKRSESTKRSQFISQLEELRGTIDSYKGVVPKGKEIEIFMEGGFFIHLELSKRGTMISRYTPLSTFKNWYHLPDKRQLSISNIDLSQK